MRARGGLWAGKKGRTAGQKQVNADSRPRAAALAGKGLAGAPRSGASERECVPFVIERNLGMVATMKLRAGKSDADRNSGTATTAVNWNHWLTATRLMLGSNIDRRFIGCPRSGSLPTAIGQIAGGQPMECNGWQRRSRNTPNSLLGQHPSGVLRLFTSRESRRIDDNQK